MDDQNALRKRLEQFPSFFKLQDDVKHLSKTVVGEIINKIRADTDFVASEVEIARSKNVMAFLYFCINDITSAQKTNTEVVARYSENVIAITSRAWMNLLRQRSYKDIEEAIEQLRELAQSEWNLVKADAEIAYLYSRIGCKCYPKAIRQFEVVLQRACGLRTNDSLDSGILDENVYLWSFGLGLIKKRCLNFNCMTDETAISRTKQAVQETVDIFRGITKRNQDVKSPCIRRCVGRSLVQLGLIMHDVNKDEVSFPKGWAEFCQSRNSQEKRDNLFDMARNLCPDDAFVLEKSGKYFRYTNEVDKSIELLEEALKIKETSFGHHHLALSLKRKVEWDIPGSKHARGRGRGRGPVRDLFNTRGRSRPNRPFTRSYADLLPHSGHQRGHLQNYSCPVMNQTHAKQKMEFARPLSFDSGIYSLESHQLSIDPVDQALTQEMQRLSFVNDSSEREELSNNISVSQLSPGLLTQRKQQPNDEILRFRANPCMSEPGFRNPHGRRGNFRGRLKHTVSVPGNPYMDECRKYAPSKHHLRLMNLIKSPRKMKHIDFDKNKNEVKKILEHLDQAMALASTNYGALYDKGLLFRQLNQPEEALETFRKIIANENDAASIIVLANSYEQAAYCLSTIGEKLEPGAEVESLEADMKLYLKCSMELSCSIVAKIPGLKNCWLGPVTLKEFLSSKPKTKTTLTDLVFLYKKLENYNAALDVLNDLKSMCGNKDEEMKILNDIVDLYVKKENFDDAILALDIIRCSPVDTSHLCPELFVKVHVKGGIQALRNGEHEISVAKLRFRSALDFVGSVKSESDNVEEASENDSDVKTGFDVFLLCENESEGKWDCMAEILNDIGLTTTVNTKDVLTGPSFAGMADIMQTSKHFLVAVDSDTLSSVMKFHVSILMGITTEDSVRAPVVVCDVKERKLPSVLKGFERLNVDIDKLQARVEGSPWSNPYVYNILEDILVTLAAPSKN